MKERPILFSGPMVLAILEGRKTQTRRIVKPSLKYDAVYGDVEESERYSGEFFQWIGGERGPSFSCPYGVPGDKLWVRETWCQKADDDGRPVYNSLGNLDSSCVRFYADGNIVLSIDADGSYEYNKDGSEKSPWKPSIHMPRWASRLTLEIESVRVERLQDISEEDAQAEGAEPILVPPDGGSFPHKEGFQSLWESINGKDSWKQNPWVWVINFKRAEGR